MTVRGPRKDHESRWTGCVLSRVPRGEREDLPVSHPPGSWGHPMGWQFPQPPSPAPGLCQVSGLQKFLAIELSFPLHKSLSATPMQKSD